MAPLAARYENAHPLSLSAGGFLLCGLRTFRRTGAVNALCPMKALFAGGGFKLEFYDAKVHFAVKPKSCFGMDIAVFIRKIKFLLVHSSGGEQGGIHTCLKPCGGAGASIAHGAAAFGAMRFSIRDAMAKRNHGGQPFTASYFKCTGRFSVCQGGPAGVQTKLLSFQHEPLPIIAACFLQTCLLYTSGAV